jgi:inosine-uridine nucleoside N-ribohydrolase
MRNHLTPVLHAPFPIIAGLALLFAASLAGINGRAAGAGNRQSTHRIPVILDSDIGDDIDDTWALGFLLQSPELDVKLIVGDQGKPLYRARLIAKFLEAASRTDIPIGIGLDANATGDGPQAAWVEDYNLNTYPGKVLPDGVRAIIDTIMKSPEPMTLLAIGPLPNVSAALEREPRIAQHARFVGMHGSVRKGYGASKDIQPEYNVKADVKACQRAFTAPWEITITPLDTCGTIDLSGDRYARVRDSNHPVAAAIIENYRLWSVAQNKGQPTKVADERSSTLFDTVAVYLAFSQDLLKMEPLGIRVDNEGFTRIDSAAKTIHVATEWQDLDGFRDLLVQRLTR